MTNILLIVYAFGGCISCFLGLFKLEKQLTQYSAIGILIALIILAIFWLPFWIAVFIYRRLK